MPSGAVAGTMMDAPILFLDFDGPLHPDEVYWVRGKIILRADGISLFEYVPVLSALLEPLPEVRIVLSTSWVRVLGFDRAKSYLPGDLQARVIGATWHRHMDQQWWQTLTRYQQIAAYVHRNEVRSWVALDNDDVGWPEAIRYRLAHVDDWLGIFDSQAQAKLVTALESICPVRG